MNTKFLFLFVSLVLCLNFGFALQTFDLNTSGGVYNGGFEYGTGTANNASSVVWIGDSNFGWKLSTATGNGILASYDSAVFHSGLQSMRLDTNGSSIQGTVSTWNAISSVSGWVGARKYFIVIKPNTNYNFSSFSKTTVVGDNNVYMDLVCYPFNGTSAGQTYTSNKLSGLNDWTKLSVSFTSDATNIYCRPRLTNWNVGDSNSWFDDVRLEEVDSVNLTSQVSGRPLITVTGVSDFNAIDQADTNNSGGASFGDGTVYSYAQCTTPTQNNQSGLVFQRKSSVGTFMGDIIISLRDSNATNIVPSLINPILTQITIPNSTWEAYPTSTDWNISLPAIIDANGTKRYCFDFNSTTQDVSNYPRVALDSSTGYSGGAAAKFNGSVWSVSASDLYFKTLFRKDSSSLDLNVVAPDGTSELKSYDRNFLSNGSTWVISPSDAPLFKQGVNQVYVMNRNDFNLNGDGTVENFTPSLMSNINLTFDKPTTTLTTTIFSPNTKQISLNCTNPITGTCTNTYYTTGSTFKEYTTPFELDLGNYTIQYYSTATNDNNEITNSSSILIPITPGKASCEILILTQLILSAILLFGLLIVLAVLKDQLSPMIIITLIMMAISGVIGIIILAAILAPVC